MFVISQSMDTIRKCIRFKTSLARAKGDMCTMIKLLRSETIESRCARAFVVLGLAEAWKCVSFQIDLLHGKQNNRLSLFHFLLRLKRDFFFFCLGGRGVNARINTKERETTAVKSSLREKKSPLATFGQSCPPWSWKSSPEISR